MPYQIEWWVFPAAVNLHEALKADAIDIGQAADSPTVSAIAGGSKIKVAKFSFVLSSDDPTAELLGTLLASMLNVHWPVTGPQ